MNWHEVWVPFLVIFAAVLLALLIAPHIQWH